MYCPQTALGSAIDCTAFSSTIPDACLPPPSAVIEQKQREATRRSHPKRHVWLFRARVAWNWRAAKDGADVAKGSPSPLPGGGRTPYPSASEARRYVGESAMVPC